MFVHESSKNSKGITWDSTNFYLFSSYVYLTELHLRLSAAETTACNYTHLKTGEIDVLFELKWFSNFYLEVILPEFFERFPRSPELESFKSFVELLAAFRESLTTMDPKIIENSQLYFKHVMVPLFLFTSGLFDDAGYRGLSLQYPDHEQVIKEGRAAEHNMDYPDREQIMKRYDRMLDRHNPIKLQSFFCADNYPKVLQFFQEKYRQLYSKFLLDFQVEEKFPGFVANSYLQPSLTLFQSEHIISFFIFFRVNIYHWYNFTSYYPETTEIDPRREVLLGGQHLRCHWARPWDVFSSLFYLFNFRTPVLDLIKFYYFKKSFVRDYKDKYFSIIFSRSIENPQLCDFIVLAITETAAYNIAYDVIFNDIVDYAPTEKKNYLDPAYEAEIIRHQIQWVSIVVVQYVRPYSNETVDSWCKHSKLRNLVRNFK